MAPCGEGTFQDPTGDGIVFSNQYFHWKSPRRSALRASRTTANSVSILANKSAALSIGRDLSLPSLHRAPPFSEPPYWRYCPSGDAPLAEFRLHHLFCTASCKALRCELASLRNRSINSVTKSGLLQAVESLSDWPAELDRLRCLWCAEQVRYLHSIRFRIRPGLVHRSNFRRRTSDLTGLLR